MSYKSNRLKKQGEPQPPLGPVPEVLIESIDYEGRGVAHADGKVLFVEGAITGERVAYHVYRKRDNFELAHTLKVLRESPMRVTPACPHFGVCGGCAMQHVEATGQVAAKQRVLEDNLARIGKVRPESMLPALHGPTWGYRRRARIGVHYVLKKGRVLVGFHERKSSFVADMHTCKVLPPEVAALIDPLATMFQQMKCRDKLPQIEIAVGDEVTVFVLRNMVAVEGRDRELLVAFADTHRSARIQWWLQPAGPDSAYPLYPLDAPRLAYTLPEFEVIHHFFPTEFTQVNLAVNEAMVSRAVRMLDPKPGEIIGDLFCGLGNFTLPIARRGAKVVGIEGSVGLVQRAKENAATNGLGHLATYRVADLYKDGESAVRALGKVDKLLIDPPRDGALEVCRALPATGIERLVYVSCSPGTLARDAGVLVHEQGYKLKAAGVVNMFPHTAHVESIALFER